MPLVVALYRRASYSPRQHRANDPAILDRTLAHFARGGWAVSRVDEGALESAHAVAALPPAALWLNMCQGAAASEALLALEEAGALAINRPSSVLACHRHRLVPALAARGVRFPATEIVDAADTEAAARSAVVRDAASVRHPVWVKRGDVHAEVGDDVVCVAPAAVPDAVATFAARGIARVALQAHVPGPVLKFYGVADGRFFRWYDAASGPDGPRPAVDEPRLRALVFDAAAALGLDVFGGDVALPSPDDPVLVDLNDWPSFAPFRDDAAAAIADYALAAAARVRAPTLAPDARASDVA
jgi:hypothetical protein